MAVKESKTRVYITLTKELNDDIQVLCDQMGISKSAFIATAVAEKVMGYKKAFEIASATLKTQTDTLIKPLFS